MTDNRHLLSEQNSGIMLMACWLNQGPHDGSWGWIDAVRLKSSELSGCSLHWETWAGLRTDWSCVPHLLRTAGMDLYSLGGEGLASIRLLSPQTPQFPCLELSQIGTQSTTDIRTQRALQWPTQGTGNHHNWATAWSPPGVEVLSRLEQKDSHLKIEAGLCSFPVVCPEQVLLANWPCPWSAFCLLH